MDFTWLNLVYPVLGLAMGVGGIFALYKARQDQVAERKQIPADIKAEIDVTPEWWDREFRRLSGEPEPQRQGRIKPPKGGSGGSDTWHMSVEKRLLASKIADLEFKISELAPREQGAYAKDDYIRPGVWPPPMRPDVSAVMTKAYR